VKNPFYYGGVVNKENFCNRKEEITQLKSDIKNGLNILLYAPRRFGKTSLVLTTVEELKNEENQEFIFIDLLGVSNVEEFINEYFNAIAKSFEGPIEKTLNFIKNILNFKPTIKILLNQDGSYRFQLEFTKSQLNQTLEEVLNLPLKYVNKGKKICVIFDEFQEVETIGIENKLRTVIQHHSNKISYIFMGSKKSILTKMFSDKTKAFYKSVKHFHIKEISKEDWIDFIKGKFLSTKKQIDDIYIEKILSVTKCFPYYTQQFAYELWENTEKKVSEDVFEKTLKIILERESDFFALEWDNLTLNQRKVLKLIIEKEGKNLYDEDYLSKYGIKVGSLKKILEILVNKDVIDKTEEKYYILDPLFEFWLKIRTFY
jgi:AAA+ ATPase superfamily predicted ATPase